MRPPRRADRGEGGLIRYLSRGFHLEDRGIAMAKGSVDRAEVFQGPTGSAPGTPPPRSKPVSAEGAPVGRRRVLVVEDQADCRESLRLLLEAEGFEVRVAAEGGDALGQALAWRPDAAVVDIGVPVLNGYEVARRVRARLGKGVRLIALTGYAQDADRRRALEAGFDVFLAKPANARLLLLLLDAAPVTAEGAR